MPDNRTRSTQPVREPLLPETLALSLGQDDDALRIGYGVGRAWGLGDPGRGHGEYEELAGGVADGVEVIVLVPVHLIYLIPDDQTGVVRDGITTVEVEYLAARWSGYGQELARRGHFHIRKAVDRNRRHIRKGAFRG